MGRRVRDLVVTTIFFVGLVIVGTRAQESPEAADQVLDFDAVLDENSYNGANAENIPRSDNDLNYIKEDRQDETSGATEQTNGVSTTDVEITSSVSQETSATTLLPGTTFESTVQITSSGPSEGTTEAPVTTPDTADTTVTSSDPSTVAAESSPSPVVTDQTSSDPSTEATDSSSSAGITQSESITSTVTDSPTTIVTTDHSLTEGSSLATSDAPATTAEGVDETSPATDGATTAGEASTIVTDGVETTTVGELDLCADVSCHDHGTCDTQTGNCTCDESWDPESFCECQVYEAVCTPDACGLMATCVAECNEPVCTCEPGLIPEGPNACRDFDECLIANGTFVCPGENTRCVNSPSEGPNQCECLHDGYSPSSSAEDDIFSCTDVDECTQDPRTVCMKAGEVPGSCRNTLGSYVCDCEVGYLPAVNPADPDAPKCIRRPAEITQCFNVQNYTCTYSNYYAEVCSSPDGIQLSCQCPHSGYLAPTGEPPQNGEVCVLKSQLNACRNPSVCGEHQPCYNPDPGLAGFVCSCKKGFRQLEDGTCSEIKDDDEASTTCMQADQEVCGKSDATCALAASGDKMCLCDEGYATQNGGVPPFSDVCVLSCAALNCLAEEQYCYQENPGVTMPECRCKVQGLVVGDDGKCASINFCAVNGGDMECQRKGQLCVSDTTRPDKYRCVCYPPLVMLDEESGICGPPTGFSPNGVKEIYQLNVTVAVSDVEANELSLMESATYARYQHILSTAVVSGLKKGLPDPTLSVVVTLSAVHGGAGLMTTAAPAVTTMLPGTGSPSTQPPVMTTEAGGTGSSTVMETTMPSTLLPTDAPESRGDISMELMRRIIRDVLPKADVEVTVSLTVLTNAPLPNPEANLRAAVVASTVVINNRTILTDGADGYIIWTETAASSASGDACAVYSVDCRDDYHYCTTNATTAPPGLPFNPIFRCACNLGVLMPAGMEFNSVFEVCADVDECAQDKCVTWGEGNECFNSFGAYECRCNGLLGSVEVDDGAGGRMCVSKCDDTYVFGKECSASPGFAECRIVEGGEPDCICKEGWHGEYCKSRSAVAEETNTAGVVGGVLGGILAVVILVAGVTIYKLRKKVRQGSRSHQA